MGTGSPETNVAPRLSKTRKNEGSRKDKMLLVRMLFDIAVKDKVKKEVASSDPNVGAQDACGERSRIIEPLHYNHPANRLLIKTFYCHE